MAISTLYKGMKIHPVSGYIRLKVRAYLHAEIER